MTSFLIAYPDIPFNATVVTPSATDSQDYPVQNLIRGERYTRFQFAAAAFNGNVQFDLGPNLTASANYLYIGRADCLKNAGVTQITLDSSSNGSTWTTRYSDASFASATLLGPGSYDYFVTFAATSAFRYWRVTYVSGASIVFSHSKVFFGTAFDFTVEPDMYDLLPMPAAEATWLGTSGALSFVRQDEQVYKVNISWVNVSDTLAAQFQSKIARYAHINPVVLYTATRTEVLDFQNVLYCEIDLGAAPHSQQRAWRNDLNRVDATFMQLLG